MSFKKIDREDAKRKNGRNCIMVYGYNYSNLILIQDCQKQAGIDEMIVISESDIHIELGSLLENPAFSEVNVPLEESFSKTSAIIFSATSHAELDRFIEASKKIEITRPIFAGTTPTNLSWTFSDLISELLREREAMKQIKS